MNAYLVAALATLSVANAIFLEAGTAGITLATVGSGIGITAGTGRKIRKFVKIS